MTEWPRQAALRGTGDPSASARRPSHRLKSQLSAVANGPARRADSRIMLDTAGIGVNAAWVAGVATPPIFDLQGSSCVDDPPIF